MIAGTKIDDKSDPPNVFPNSPIKNKKYVIRKVINNMHELISYLDVWSSPRILSLGAWRYR